jgi:hypothetical protein
MVRIRTQTHENQKCQATRQRYSLPIQPLALGDLVRFVQDLKIVAVLERGAHSRQAAYDPGDSDETASRNQALRTYLADFGIVTENAVPGVLLLSVPADLDDARLADVCAGSPVPLRLLAPDR